VGEDWLRLPHSRHRRRRVGLAARLARPEVQLGLLARHQRLVGKVLVHPVQMVVPAHLAALVELAMEDILISGTVPGALVPFTRVKSV